MKYKINLARTEYYYQVVEVEADTEDQAVDKAWDQSGKWLFADAEEFTNGVDDIFFEEPDTYDEYGVNTKNSFNTPPKEAV